jgi:hypothetical protein
MHASRRESLPAPKCQTFVILCFAPARRSASAFEGAWTARCGWAVHPRRVRDGCSGKSCREAGRGNRERAAWARLCSKHGTTNHIPGSRARARYRIGHMTWSWRAESVRPSGRANARHECERCRRKEPRARKRNLGACGCAGGTVMRTLSKHQL